MKTIIDLPPDLVREMKLLAAYEGRKFKDVAADLLKRGLITGNTKPKNTARRDFLLSAPVGAPEMTPERVREILGEAP
jgi:plasmid stability protein